MVLHQPAHPPLRGELSSAGRFGARRSPDRDTARLASFPPYSDSSGIGIRARHSWLSVASSELFPPPKLTRSRADKPVVRLFAYAFTRKNRCSAATDRHECLSYLIRWAAHGLRICSQVDRREHLSYGFNLEDFPEYGTAFSRYQGFPVPI